MSCHGRRPNTPPQECGVNSRNMTTATEHSVGMRKFRFRLSTDDLRYASSGPTAVSSNSMSATGTFTRLKKGGPTVTFVPCTHSLRIGNNVPHKTVKQATRRIRLLNRKL